MANEKLKEFRDWANLILTLVTVAIIPTGLLVLRNQRLEMREEMRKEYVSLESYRNTAMSQAAENGALKVQLENLSIKIDRMQVTLVRLTDAVKLANP
jgi:Tfp pilus assembly protein PilO